MLSLGFRLLCLILLLLGDLLLLLLLRKRFLLLLDLFSLLFVLGKSGLLLSILLRLFLGSDLLLFGLFLGLHCCIKAFAIYRPAITAHKIFGQI